jgi:hypothetical protein
VIGQAGASAYLGGNVDRSGATAMNPRRLLRIFRLQLFPFQCTVRASDFQALLLLSGSVSAVLRYFSLHRPAVLSIAPNRGLAPIHISSREFKTWQQAL